MNNSEEMFQAAGETVEYARQYIEQQGELLRLEAAERLAKVISTLVTFFVLAFFVMLVLVMLSIAAALWLGKMLDSYVAAFLIIAIIYAGLGVLFYFFRLRFITNPALGAMLSAFFEEED